MPTADTSLSWPSALGWLAAIAATGFLITWVLTSRLGMRRTPYIAALALLTASPLAAVGGHILMHTALNLRGTEMPPYATGGAHIVPIGHQRPTTKPSTPVG
jgi:hypothetical protein